MAVVTSTSCFAPRACDDVEAVARLCRDKDVGHVINNAYGVQSKELCARVNKAWTVGRVDAVVQSTDKNFLVPSAARPCAPGRTTKPRWTPSPPIIPDARPLPPPWIYSSPFYPWAKRRGRACSTSENPCTRTCAPNSKKSRRGGRRVLASPKNPISMAMTLTCASSVGASPTMFGSMLFSRCVSGTRVIAPGETQTVGGIEFRGLASHSASDDVFTARRRSARRATTSIDSRACCGRRSKTLRRRQRRRRARHRE